MCPTTMEKPLTQLAPQTNECVCVLGAHGSEEGREGAGVQEELEST